MTLFALPRTGCPGGLGLALLGGEQARQVEDAAQQRQGAGLQRFPAGQAVAATPRAAQHGDHRGIPPAEANWRHATAGLGRLQTDSDSGEVVAMFEIALYYRPDSGGEKGPSPRFLAEYALIPTCSPLFSPDFSTTPETRQGFIA